MGDFNFGELASVLSKIEEIGVSFEGKANKWETEFEANDLIEAINDCKELIYLNLEGNTLGVDAAKGIGEALKKHPELKKALWKDLFTGRLKTEIPKALEYLGKGMIAGGVHLSVLDCSDNALGPNGMAGLVDLLKSPTCFSLQELMLNNCGLGIGGGKMLAKALLEGYAASVKAGTPLALKVFIAGRNRLENDGAKALAEVFGTLKSLEEIAMPQNGIYHVGIAALAEAFKKNVNMRVLNLNDNTIGTKGAAALAEAFYSMQKLKEINFGDCLLKTRGALLLSDALSEEHQLLETLNFGFNEIGPEGGLSMAAAMCNKVALKSLILNGNQFGNEYRTLIREELEEYNQIETLGSLSEDDSEGEEDEDEDDDNQQTDEEDEEDETDEDDDDETNEETDEEAEEGELYINESVNQTLNNAITSDSLNNSSLMYAGEEIRPDTVENFCNTPNPSLEMFNALQEKDKVAEFRKFLKTIPEENYLIYLVFVILKCSGLSLKSKEALEVSDALYMDCLDYAKTHNQMTRIKNFFLIQLGLLKSEDRTFKPCYDLRACRHAMESAMKINTFPDDLRNTFRLFLDRFKLN